MPNNGTPYDKYCQGWWDEGDPPYSRSMRDKFAIEDSLDSNHYDWWEEKRSRQCYCDEDESFLCGQCDNRVTDEQARLASRKKHKANKPVRSSGHASPRCSWRWYRSQRMGRTINAAPVSEMCQHIWVERERWVPHEGYTNYRTKVERPPYMVLHRYWLCKDCRGERGFGEIKVRRDLTKVKPQHGRFRYYLRGSETVTREMTPQELKDFEAKKAKEDPTYKGPKTYGVKEDGQHIDRNEFKQAPKKRLTRKREDA